MMFFKVSAFTGWDWLLSLVYPYSWQAQRVAREIGSPDVRVQLPCGLWYLVKNGRAVRDKAPDLPHGL